MSRLPMAQLVEYADRHFGVFTIKDARRFGVTNRMLHYRARQRLVERLYRGVYRVVGAHESWRQNLVAALAQAGPGAVASHRSAAALHRFDGFSDGPIEIRARELYPVDRCTVGGIPATSPVRTLIDLGTVVDKASLVRALDSAERDGKVQRRVLTRRLAEVGNRRGTATLRQVLARREEVGHTPRTVLERAFLDLLAAHGLPAPVCQYEVRRRNGRTAFLDFAYVALLLAIEVDGNGSHATPAQRASDNQRSNELPGWRVLRFTYEDVTHRGAYVADTVGSHLSS